MDGLEHGCDWDSILQEITPLWVTLGIRGEKPVNWIHSLWRSYILQVESGQWAWMRRTCWRVHFSDLPVYLLWSNYKQGMNVLTFSGGLRFSALWHLATSRRPANWACPIKPTPNLKRAVCEWVCGFSRDARGGPAACYHVPLFGFETAKWINRNRFGK